jgi:hypothetical protein
MAEFFVLNTGARIPSVGLGTATGKAEPGVVGQAVYAAVKVSFKYSLESPELLLFSFCRASLEKT